MVYSGLFHKIGRCLGLPAGILLLTTGIFAQDIRVVSLKVFPQDFELYFQGKAIPAAKVRKEYRDYRLPPGLGEYELRSPGYHSLRLVIDPARQKTLELKLEKTDSPLRLLAELPTGGQPKSVIFSPDGSRAFTAQLSGAGIDVFDISPSNWVEEIDIPPPGRKSTGFVEFAMLPWQDEIWVSQMNTAQIHVIGLSDLEYRESFSSGGVWTKVILARKGTGWAAVSNWLSLDVSIIDTTSRKVLHTLKCSGIPRGLELSHDGKMLYVANYDNGTVECFSTATWKPLPAFKSGPGAKRHLVMHPEKNILYASDMATGELNVFDLDSGHVSRVPVAQKLNSMDISPDGRFLFISSRGHNNPETYLRKGPDFGTLWVIDTATLEKVAWVWGRNQPTGVAVSPTQKIVAFTDFLDDNLELYDYSGLYGESTQSRVSQPQVSESTQSL